jgi:hypothetical protein
MTAYATDTFNGDGSTVEFTIDFDYIQRDHVQVYRVETANNAETELTVIASGDPGADQYVWETDRRIRVGTAPTDEQQLKVQRDTPEDQQLVQWRDGSYIIAKDLNDSDLQWLYGLQELEDKFSQLQSTAIKYLGAIDLTVDPAPAQPASGDFYINTGTGVVLDSWDGIAGDDVIGSEQVVYNGNLNEWQIFVVPASQIGVVSVTGTDPIAVDNTDPQRPVVSFEGQLDVIVQDDAPDDPEEGWLWFSTTDNRLYVYTGNEWVDASPMGTAACSIGDSFPLAANSTPGDLFWHTEFSTLFVFYTDEDSSQWVTASPTGAGNEGGASVEVGETPPDPATSAAGDLFWSEDTGRLYVFAQGAWIDASPDGAAPAFWTRTDGVGIAPGSLSPATENDSLALTGIHGEFPAFTIVNPNNARMSIGSNKDGEGVIDGSHLGFWKNPGGAAIFTSGGDLRIAVDGAQEPESSITIGSGLGDTNWLAFDSNGYAEFRCEKTNGALFNIAQGNNGADKCQFEFAAGAFYIGNGLEKNTGGTGATITMGVTDGDITADGDITTAGRLLVSGLNTSDNSSRGLRIREVDSKSFTTEIQAHSGVNTSQKAICVYKGNTDIWHVDYDGNASFRNATFKLEPDSSANYISTTNAEGETEAVYNGPVLSVLDELLDLRKRATQQDAVIAQLVTALRSQGVQIDTTDIQEDS